MRNRRMGIDFLRVVSMLAVMLGHVSSTYIYNESRVAFLGMNLAFFLNQGARFCVPLFFLLSGFSLGMKEWAGGYLAFLKKRAARILVPYVVWTLLYLWSNTGFDLGAWLVQLGDLPGLLRTLLTGDAAPHLYFIPILFQCYLLYPLLKKWVEKSTLGSALWAFGVTFFLQSLYVLQDMKLLPRPRGIDLWMTFPVWGFYFVAGMCFQRVSFHRLRDLCREHGAALSFISVTALILYTSWSQLTGMLHAFKPELTVITVLLFLWGFGAWEVFRRRAVARKAVALLSAHSMGIYFDHVLILCFLRQFPRFQEGMSGMLLLFLATLCLSAAAAVLFGVLWRLGRRAARGLDRARSPAQER